MQDAFNEAKSEKANRISLSFNAVDLQEQYMKLKNSIGTIKITRAYAEETITITDPQANKNWEEFVNAAIKVSKIYNYPAKVVIAQGALESARGSSNFCTQRHNCLGVGAFDSNPDNAYQYENKEQALVDYMKLIQRNFPEAWANRKNPDVVILKLKFNNQGLMYATDPAYITKVKAMPEWSKY